MKPPYTRAIRSIYGSSRGRTPFFLERPSRRRRAWWLALFLFLSAAAVGVSFYFFGQTGPAFTGDRFNISLVGNANPRPGRAGDYTLILSNNEEVAVDGAELFIDFARPFDNGPRPAGKAASAEALIAPSAVLISAEPPPLASGGATWKLGEIKSGQKVEIKLKLSFWGKSGQEIILPFVATFRPKGFGSDFSAVGSQKFVLGEPSLGVDISGPDKVASGAEAAFIITIANAADEVSFKPEEWTLEANAPRDFEVISFDPPAPGSSDGVAAATQSDALGGATWPLSALPLAGGRRALSLRGRVQTASGGEAIFSVHLTNTLRGLRINAEKKVIVKNSDVFLSLRATPEEGKKLQWGEKVTWQIEVKNQGRENLLSGIVSVALSGDEFWQSRSLAAGAGRFEGGSIFWDKTSAKELEKIAPGQSVSLFFSFTALPAPPVQAAAAVILADGRFRGRSDVGEVEARSGEVAVKILANIDLSAGAQYQSGPHPPLPGQETLYGAEWTVGPSTGPFSDVRLALVLPADVEWKEGGEAGAGELSYEQAGRAVVWRAVNLARLAEPMTIRFTVGFTPSDEVTNDLLVLGASTFTAKDGGSGETIDLYAPAVKLGEVK